MPNTECVKKTICKDCHLIFRDGRTVCPKCKRTIQVLGTVNAPAIWEKQYFYYNSSTPFTE